MRYARSRRIAAAAAASVLLAACSGSAVDSGDEGGTGDPSDASGQGDTGDAGEASQGSLTIGLINPLTGPYAALGEDINAALEMYVDERGGVLAGYEIEILSEDEANDTAAAIEGVERMLGAGADVLVGFVNSGVAYGASEVIREAGVPLIITTAGADDLTQRNAADNIFRINYTSSQDAMPLAEYACNELGYERVAMLALDYAFGWEAAGGFASVYEDAGCEIVQELYGPLGTPDWAPFVQQIDSSADAVWVAAPGSDGIRLLQAYDDFGVDLPLIGHGALTDEQTIEAIGASGEGVITTLHYSGALATEANEAHRRAFEERFGRRISMYSEAGQAAAQVIEAALERAEDTSSESLIAALHDVEVEAPRGPLSFDEYGQGVYPVYVREMVQDADEGWVNRIVHTYDDVSQFWTFEAEEFMAQEPLAERRGTWAD